ncbi:MAG TPA: L-fucose:H+ symporter permease [Candidatus Sulfotelmatobacter sp.]|nr:L-fucose:H+ symporter permease [Candidatus Sulfotelmatobacter sp.]
MENITARPSSDASAPEKTQTGALITLTSLFFMWGFVTVLNDIVSPHLQSIFDLSYKQASLVQFAFFFAYFIFSIPAAKLIGATSYKTAIVVGLLTTGVGAFLFIPAASAASFVLFLGALVVLAAGITVLQVAANPYVAVLGPPKTASSRLNLTQAFNSLGTTIGPWIGGIFILTTTAKSSDELKSFSAQALQAYKVEQASSVKTPYLFIGLLLVALAIVIYFLRLPSIPEAQKKGHTPGVSLWKYRHLVLGVVGIFVYVGAEVSIGTFLIKYFHLHEIGDLPEKQGAQLVAYYWGGAMIGRFIGSAILQKLKAGTVLGIAAFCACALVLTSMLTSGHVAMASIILVGFFNSIMFPSIFTLGIADLGPLTGEGSGLLIMAIVGGAIIPLLFGALADMPAVGLHHAFILPAVCYLYIAYYGLSGSRPREVQ